jgi:ABC-type dipeptide/oligopeptide/nickel transport system permease component
MLNYLLRRTLAALLFVAVVSTSAVVLTRLAPGDATSGMRETGSTEIQVAAERARLGLDRPIYEQVGIWLRGLVRLDLGQTRAGLSVRTLVIAAAANTALLAAFALLLATGLGVPLGILTGARPRGWLATIVLPVSIALLACPPIVGALALLLVAIETGWLSVAPGSLALPALALALPIAASLERLQSQATGEMLAGPEIAAAAARGIPRGRLLWVHAARQSLRPVLGVYGIVIASLFSGSLAVEAITSWPGLGRLMWTAVTSREIFLTAGCALAGAILIAAGNLVADVLRAIADPRVRGRA